MRNIVKSWVSRSLIFTGVIVVAILSTCTPVAVVEKLTRQQTADGYAVRSWSLCKPGEEGFVTDEMLAHMKDPYDTLIENKIDSSLVSFSFIGNCLVRFTGLASVQADTLTLTYGYAPNLINTAGCFCEYRIRFALSNSRIRWNQLAIKHESHIYPRKN